MLIRESTLRRIIREEAARAMNEQFATTPTAQTASGATAVPVRTTAQLGPAMGPIDPKKVAAARAKYVSAADEFKKIFVRLTINFRAIRQKHPADLQISELGSMATAFSYIPGDDITGKFPNDPVRVAWNNNFQRARSILEAGRVARISVKDEGIVQEALAALAAGEFTAAGITPTSFGGPGVLKYFVRKKFDPNVEAWPMWRDTKAVKFAPANEIAQTVKPIAQSLLQAWDNLLFAMGGYDEILNATSPGNVPTAPATPSPAPKPAARKPAMTWDKFVATVKGGQQIKSAWDRYALASVPPLNVNDYSLFKRWWDDYRSKNPGWTGSPVETVAALAKETTARRAANRAG